MFSSFCEGAFGVFELMGFFGFVFFWRRGGSFSLLWLCFLMEGIYFLSLFLPFSPSFFLPCSPSLFSFFLSLLPLPPSLLSSLSPLF